VAARRASALAGGSGGAGTTTITNVYALHSAEYARLLANAQRGGAAHDWISRRENAYATVGS
jgi:hypothetical protein